MPHLNHRAMTFATSVAPGVGTAHGTISMCLSTIAGTLPHLSPQPLGTAPASHLPVDRPTPCQEAPHVR